MAQMERMKSLVKNTKEADSDHLQGVEGRWGSPATTPTLGRHHDQEEDHDHQTKKSVLTKVKEKAKKWRHTLSSKKKHGNDGTSTPEWGVSLEDENEDEEPEYLGAPIYESEMVNEGSKDVTNQHSKTVPVSEKHIMVTGVNSPNAQNRESPRTPISGTVSTTHLFKPKLKDSPTKSTVEPLTSTNLKQKQKESLGKSIVEPMSSTDLKQKQKESPNSPITEPLTSTNVLKQKHKESPRSPIMEAVTSTANLLKPKHKESPNKPITDPVSSINFFKQKSKERSPTCATTVPSNNINLIKQQDRESPSKRITEPSALTDLPKQHYEESFIDSMAEPVTNIDFPEQQQKEHSSRSITEPVSNINLPKQQQQQQQESPLNTMNEYGTSINLHTQQKENPTETMTEAVTSIDSPKQQEKDSPSKTMTESVTEKLAPAYAVVSDATNAITSKIQRVATSTSSPPSKSEEMSRSAHKWDKGVSVKEYLMQKLEPGDEERALSQVISETISPKKGAGDTGVVEKFRDAVSSMLSSPSTSTINTSTMNTSTNIPLSTNAQEVVMEENQGRRLQTN